MLKLYWNINGSKVVRRDIDHSLSNDSYCCVHSSDAVQIRISRTVLHGNFTLHFDLAQYSHYVDMRLFLLYTEKSTWRDFKFFGTTVANFSFVCCLLRGIKLLSLYLAFHRSYWEPTATWQLEKEFFEILSQSFNFCRADCLPYSICCNSYILG